VGDGGGRPVTSGDVRGVLGPPGTAGHCGGLWGTAGDGGGRRVTVGDGRGLSNTSYPRHILTPSENNSKITK